MADDSVMQNDDTIDDTIDMEHYRTLVQRFIGLVCKQTNIYEHLASTSQHEFFTYKQRICFPPISIPNETASIQNGFILGGKGMCDG